MSSVEPKSRVSLVASVVLALTFLLGAATGVGAAWWARGTFPPRPPHGPIPLEELGLTHAQRAKVDEILERYHPQFDAVFRSTFPRVRAISESLEADVREVLDERQKARFDALKAQRPSFPPPRGPWQAPPGPPPGRGFGTLGPGDPARHSD